MPLLLAKLPSEDAQQRLLDVLATAEVARESGVFIYVIEDDGRHRRVLVGEPR